MNSKYVKTKQTKNLIELQGGMGKSTVTVRGINFPLSIIYRKETHTKRKKEKETQTQNHE